MTDVTRKPLCKAELDAEPTTVCVTGATGYIAASIIQRLLAAGHTVHATMRDPSATHRVAHLLELDGAQQRLQLFKADLQEEGSFDTAVGGCRYVLHTASPVTMAVQPGEERQKLLEPAVKGVENVLAAVNRTPSVQRVVLTSSVAAVAGVHQERGAGHVFTEDEWNISATETHLPYHLSKVMAEQRAWEMAKTQGRWSLVTILPSVVQGPPLGNIKCESVGFMRKLLNGAMWPIVPAVGFSIVDVDDVAAAHTLAMVSPNASGRYLCTAEGLSIMQYLNLMRPRLGSSYRMAWLQAPWLLVALLGALGIVKSGYLDLARAAWGPAPQFDSSRIQKELGLQFVASYTCALDMVARMEGLGILKPHGAKRKPKQT